MWSGDTVRMDEDGFLYFIGRKDDLIKTSGYRVSPTEIEEVLYGSGQVAGVLRWGFGIQRWVRLSSRWSSACGKRSARVG